ncbi:bifunctional alpha,alpha-trehalose-phosphate synthase (UDP-forming)/trehalose-phosphatase [Candidatus Saccharibacteria bacterium]|nr:bifunctional alpha,alpha-trehalose-phosphate synthase (UDP-forming)/trehalose-phosphatase [Candidatus Saccharibacteria bacterium]
MKNFIIVSNRLPVNVSRVEGKLEFNMSTGGLATAMSSLDGNDHLWVGWPGIASDDLTPAEKAQITKVLRRYSCYPVYLSAQQVADFYEGYSNDTLWPIFHYFQAYAQYSSEYWKAYKAVNKKFLSAVKRCATNDATLWIQDYQLMLLPGLARTSLPEAKIGFFLHIPFPSYEVFRLLPERKEIIEGLMGADLLGFHIYDYARHFLSSASRILGVTSQGGAIEYKGRHVQVDSFPIGIDYAKFRSTLRQKSTKNEIARLTDRYKNQKILLSVDRLDYSKGIMKRLDAFDMFLATHPNYHQKVTLIIVAVPSRTEVETYKNLRDEIEQTVSRINGMYSTIDWSPISYQFQGLPFHDVVALYAKADVALVTPLRDGMNLVAKEYVASKSGRNGVLILSEMAGAADELHESLFVNPNDTVQLSDAIYKALNMSKSEQQRRLKIMQQRIGYYTVQRWAQDFMEQLNTAHESHRGAFSKRLSSATANTIAEAYSSAKSRLLLFDYDGTLRGFSNSISAAAVKPTPKLKTQLRRLTSQPNTHVCIISGRPRAILDTWFRDIPSLILVAEHGAWIRDDKGWQQSASHTDMTEVRELMRNYASRTPGAIVENKDFATVWHYRLVSPELAYIRNADLLRQIKHLVNDTELGVYNGNKIIEVKPKSIHKGEVATQLAQKFPGSFVLCAGDDYTDEHMFKAMPHEAHTVKVGLGNTHAKYQVATVERMTALVDTLSKQPIN